MLLKSIADQLHRALLLLSLLLNSPLPARAWGDQAHRLVNAAAVASLPEPLGAYFRARKAFWVEHATEPDVLALENPEERAHHYTEVEAYDPYPFLRFRKMFVDERRTPTAAQVRYGDSVWQIERFTLRLEEALRRGQWDGADRDALFAAHYACDLTQPLHTVMNYDGQWTNQSGIHARFETDLVKVLADRWIFERRPPTEEKDLRARIFREMLESYRDRTRVFSADRAALAGRRYQDPQYLVSFARLAGPLAKKRLEAAVSFVSSLWYTAWVRAGKPDLRSASVGGRREPDLWLPTRAGDAARRRYKNR